MVLPLVNIASGTEAQSQPPSIAAMLVWLVIFGVFVWGGLSGWLADGIHRMWAGTWMLPGVMSDLPTLRRIYRWFTIFLVLLVGGICVAAISQRFHHATPTI